MTKRKEDHIDLAFKSQTVKAQNYGLFYEPILNRVDNDNSRNVFEKKLDAPLWISSMTGGSDRAGDLNRMFAHAAQKYKIGLGLGSCRTLLESDERLADFQMRNFCPDAPILANLGIAQVHAYLKQNLDYKITAMMEKIDADGLIIHINPLQEFFQPEGDIINFNVYDVIEDALKHFDFPILIKEVGQGMGPKSLEALLSLPIYGIELAAFGGTNFSKLESMRAQNSIDPMILAGHDASEMIDWIKKIKINDSCKMIIISGGIENMLHGHSLIEKLANKNRQSFIGQASAYLKYALEGEAQLDEYIENQIKTYSIANQYMRFYE